MTYRGIVQNGVIVLDGGAKLADGTAVQIRALVAYVTAQQAARNDGCHGD